MNEQNLKKYSEYTESEKAEFHRQGGIASGQSKRRRKTFAETLRAVLASEYPVEDAKKKLQSMGLDGTWMDQLSQAQVTPRPSARCVTPSARTPGRQSMSD